MRLSGSLPTIPQVQQRPVQLTEHEDFYGIPRRYVDVHDTPDLNSRLNAMADTVERPWYLRIMRAFTFGTQPFIRAYAEGEHGIRGGASEPMTWKRRWALGMAPGLSGVPALLIDAVRHLPGMEAISRGEAQDTMLRHLEVGANVAGAFGTGLVEMVPQFLQTLTGLDEVAQKLAPGVAAPKMLDFRDVLSVYEPQLFQRAGAGSFPDNLSRVPLIGKIPWGDAQPSWGDLLGFGLDVIADVNNFAPTLKLVGAGGKFVAAAAKEQKAYRVAAEAMHSLTQYGGPLMKLGEDGKPLNPWVFSKVSDMLDFTRRSRNRVNEVVGGYFNQGRNLEVWREAGDQLQNYQSRAQNQMYNEFAPAADETARSLVEKYVLPEARRKDLTGAFYHIDPDAPTPGRISAFRRGFGKGKDAVPAMRALQDLTRDHMDTVFMRVEDDIGREVYDPLKRAFEQYKKTPKADVADPWFQHVKGWIEELEGPADLDAMFHAVMSDSTDYWSRAADEYMEDILQEIGNTKPGLSQAVREFVAFAEPWQRRIGQIGVQDGAIPQWLVDSLARVHTMRAWERWMDPAAFSKAAEVSDWVLASELNPAGMELRALGKQRAAGVGGRSGSTPFAERGPLRTVASIAAEDEGMYDQIIRAGETIGRRTGNAVMLGPQDIDRLGKVSWLESSLRQMELVHAAHGRQQFLRHIASQEGKTIDRIAGEVFQGVDVDWERLGQLYRIPVEAAEEGAPPVGQLRHALERVGMRQPGEDASRWFARLVDDFGIDGAKRIRERIDPLVWRNKYLGDSPYWGPLQDAYLPKDLAAALIVGKGSPGQVTASLPTLFGLKNISQTAEWATGRWKFMKTRLSPSYYGRNFISNKILTYMQHGFDVKPRHFVDALKTMRAKEGPIWDALSRHTDILTSTFGHSELQESFAKVASYDSLLGGLPREAWSAYKKAMAGINKGAAFMEEWDKVAIFQRYYPDLRLAYEADPGSIPEKWIRRLQPGVEHGSEEFFDATASMAAADLAHTALFHYGKTPPVVNFMRGFGVIPFITFPYKALPQVFLNSIENPQRMGLFAKTFEFLESVDPMRDELEAAEPEWMRTGGWIRVPIRHGNKTYHLDLTYVLPWGDIAEHGSMFTAYRNPDQKVVVNPNIPLLNWIAEMSTGTDLFTGRDIWKPHDPLGVKLQKGFAKMAENVLPPAFGGSGFGNKLMGRIAYSSPRFRKIYEDLPVVGGALKEMWMPASEQPHTIELAMYAAGLKTRPFNVQRERQLRWWEVQQAVAASEENRRKLTKTYLRTNQSPEAYAEDLRQEQEQLRRWIDNNPYVRWLRRSYVSPSLMDGN